MLVGGCSKNNGKKEDPYKIVVKTGKKQLSQGNFKDAEKTFLNALSINDKKPDAHYGLMLSYVGEVVNELGAIIKLATSLAPEFSPQNFQPQGLDLKKIFGKEINILTTLFGNIKEQADFLEKNFEWVSFKVDHFPLHFNTSLFLGEEAQKEFGNTDQLDLGGEWGLVELYWIDGMADFLLGVMDLIGAHDLNVQEIPSDLDITQGFEISFIKILRANPNLLGPDPDPEQAKRLFKVGDEWGEAFIQWADVIDEGTVELKHDPDQSDNVVPILDINKNGKYDTGDGIGLYKLLPIGINPDIANLFGKIYFSESMGSEVKSSLFDDWKNFLINVGHSLEGKLDRRLSIEKDLNPVLRDLNEFPMANIVELDFHALFDEDHLEYLRDLLPYVYYDDKVRHAYVFVVEHNDPYMTKDEIVSYARMQTEFADKVTYATPGTNPIWHDVFCLVDQSHFDVQYNDNYKDVQGLEKIPPDCLIDVDQKYIHITYPVDTTVPDHPSLTYIAFKDPTFSGLGCINMDNWPKPENYFTGIPDPWIPPDIKGKGCLPPTQYTLNTLFQYFTLYFEGQEVEIFGFNLNTLFNNYKNVFSFTPQEKK